MPRPCPHPDAALPPAGRPYAAGACRPCWLYVNRVDYRRLWDGPGPADRPPIVTARPRCRHELRTLEFASCKCEAKHVRECALHDRCTRGNRRSELRCCLDCADHAPADPGGPPAVAGIGVVLTARRGGAWTRLALGITRRVYGTVPVLLVDPTPRLDVEALADQFPAVTYAVDPTGSADLVRDWAAALELTTVVATPDDEVYDDPVWLTGKPAVPLDRPSLGWYAHELGVDPADLR